MLRRRKVLHSDPAVRRALSPVQPAVTIRLSWIAVAVLVVFVVGGIGGVIVRYIQTDVVPQEVTNGR